MLLNTIFLSIYQLAAVAARKKAKEDAKLAKVEQKKHAKLARQRAKEEEKLAKRTSELISQKAVPEAEAAQELSEEIESVTMMGFSVEWAKFALTQTQVSAPPPPPSSRSDAFLVAW